MILCWKNVSLLELKDKKQIFNLLLTISYFLSPYAYAQCMQWQACAGRSDTCGVSFFTSTTWVLGSNSGCQAWQQRPLPAKPSSGPFRSFLLCGRGNASTTVHMWRSELTWQDSALSTLGVPGTEFRWQQRPSPLSHSLENEVILKKTKSLYIYIFFPKI